MCQVKMINDCLKKWKDLKEYVGTNKKKTKKAFSFIGCALLRNKWQTDNLMTAINIRVND